MDRVLAFDRLLITGSVWTEVVSGFVRARRKPQVLQSSPSDGEHVTE